MLESENMQNDQSYVAIVDYGIGNLFSVKRACEKVGINAFVTSDKNVVAEADALILPGVGAFSSAMHNLKVGGLIDPIQKFSTSGKYIMGICLGMQLLMDESEEFGIQKGLGIVPGTCRKFIGSKLKTPQIMWNKIYAPTIEPSFSRDSPLHSIRNNEFMYFVHSYYVTPKSDENVLSLTNYNGFEYCSAIIKDKIFGFQFHPEKSGIVGLNIYENFKNLIYND